ncbi:uracil-DNA glycosylase [Alkalihalobacillus sp. MEB130]|uniref:uracil-DNA glycosylase n=1 Tax=Alkalihalobacillus sp. MEB130 TaxID=2976704 RepID=UPI0028E08675|nr:uracil-DNA glycosylase [Alkalihalobacillus sp. MEB130]MDT8861903.1 uracil-DNA glycosylase [Alkalihalobacillus sp. MEB130]
MRAMTNDWKEVIGAELEKEYFLKLEHFLNMEYQQNTVYPPQEDLFRAFEYTPYTKTKVVIIGQDPYHGPNQAHGLSFSVTSAEKIPPSLKNIYKELQSDLGCNIPSHGSLLSWAKQGVLLLNTVLTVREGEAASHKGQGWELFTDAVIQALNEREEPVVFVLWGRHAQAKKDMITNPAHSIIESAHPSPFSARKGFFGSRPFSKINLVLKENGHDEIVWDL